MSANIVVTHRVFPGTFDRLRSAGRVIAPSGEKLPPQELRAALQDADAVMVFMPDRVDAEFLAVAPQLSIVAAALKGYDNLDVAACTRRGVRVSIVPDLLTAPTAELSIGLILGLARHLREADAYVRSGSFSGWTPRFYGLGLTGSTVGLVGLGAIGRAIARRLGGFDCRLLYYDASSPSDSEDAALTQMPLDRLLGESDVVVLCLPLSAETLHLFDDARLRRMKPGALLINPARGSLVDEPAVARALDSGQLGGYAADAFELEDLSRPHRPREIPAALLMHPRTLFGAHIGSATVQARQAIELRAAENILDALAGRIPLDAVNVLSGKLGCTEASESRASPQLSCSGR
jgi:phosphonate dehydrogenase